MAVSDLADAQNCRSLGMNRPMEIKTVRQLVSGGFVWKAVEELVCPAGAPWYQAPRPRSIRSGILQIGSGWRAFENSEQVRDLAMFLRPLLLPLPQTEEAPASSAFLRSAGLAGKVAP